MGDFVWIEENGRSILARVTQTIPWEPYDVGWVDAEIDFYALVFERGSSRIKNRVPIERLTKAEGALAKIDFCTSCETKAMDVITEKLGEARSDVYTMFAIRSAIRHAILTELRQRNITL